MLSRQGKLIWTGPPDPIIPAMERVMGGVVPLVLGGLGLVLLYRLLQRLQQGATIQDTVVVITGASSGLGRGELFWIRKCNVLNEAVSQHTQCRLHRQNHKNKIKKTFSKGSRY